MLNKSALIYTVVTLTITVAGFTCMYMQLHWQKKILHRVKRKTEDKFIQEALKEHNRLRALHKSPPLKLDKTLCPFAEEWSKKIAADSEKAGKISMVHSRKGLGENLATCKCHEWSATKVTKAWYDEIKIHNFSGKFNWKSGHFSQLVWKTSTNFCIAYTKTKRFIAVVAHYTPHGNDNYIKSYKENVRPLGK